MRQDNAARVREYLRWCRDERGMRPTTLDTYAQTCQALVDFLGGKPLTSMSATVAQDFLARPRVPRSPKSAGRRTQAPDGTGSASTRSRELATLRSLYKFLRAAGTVKGDPLALTTTPKIRKAQPKPMDDDLWVRLWGHKRLPLDGRVALGLGYFCGFRRVEIISIGPHHVSPLVGKFIGFDRKGGGDDTLDYAECVRTVADFLPHLCPDPDEFLGDVEQLTMQRRGKSCLIPWGDDEPATDRARKVHDLPDGACDPQALYKRMMTWQRQAGIPAGKRVSPHPLRHSFVTNLLRCGVPIHIVSRLANHANITTTMGYAKIGGSELAEWRKGERPQRTAIPRRSLGD